MSLSARTPSNRVYPRACGGTNSAAVGPSETDIMGLSPRLRGNRLPRLSAVLPNTYPGSIPAPAGEPYPGRPLSRWPDSRVYPRACGGTFDARLPGITRAYGSIPAPAGEPLRDCDRLAKDSSKGSIPAPAGEPPMALISDGPELFEGLSPRLRGNLQHFLILDALDAPQGSIPAPAGEPTKITASVRHHRVGSIPAPAGEPWRPAE